MIIIILGSNFIKKKSGERIEKKEKNIEKSRVVES